MKYTITLALVTLPVSLFSMQSGYVTYQIQEASQEMPMPAKRRPCATCITNKLVQGDPGRSKSQIVYEELEAHTKDW